nr:transcriptional regulator [Aetokthonos hydrillicola CCALA 1050]
ELDLRSQEYGNSSRQDIENYIWFFLQENPKTKDSLSKWIQDRKFSALTFVETITEKSQNNFMYLYHLLPGIAKGEYNDFSELDKFPKGLKEYYQTHWKRMGMDTEQKEKMVIILFILVESTPISCEMIAEIAEQDEYDVQKVLDQWVEYLKDQNIDGKICYSIYHTSFLDFLKRKAELETTRKLFKEVNQRMAEYFKREMA